MSVSVSRSEIGLPNRTTIGKGSVAPTEAPDMPESVRERVDSNIGLVVNIACRYHNRRLSLEDLVHEGVLGLIRAAREFEPDRGYRFAGFAGWWIRKYIRLALAREWFSVHVPCWQARRIRRLRAAIRTLTQALGRPPQGEEISAEVGIPAGEVDRLLRFCPREQGLEEDRKDWPHGPRLNSMVDPFTLSPEDAVLVEEQRRIVREAVAELSILEQVVISHRFGLGTDEPLTLTTIGGICGLTRQRILQVEANAKKRLRRRVSRKGWGFSNWSSGAAR
jgi:RNA polymerase primary sigma factor